MADIHSVMAEIGRGKKKEERKKEERKKEQRKKEERKKERRNHRGKI